MTVKKHKILFVEDYPETVEVLEDIFEDYEDYEVTFKTTAEEGLAFLQENLDIECIFLDHNLPGMSGLAFLKEQLKIESIKDIPVIMQTMQSEKYFPAYISADSAVVCFLQKPYKISQIMESLEAVINKENIPKLKEEMKAKIVQAKNNELSDGVYGGYS